MKRAFLIGAVLFAALASAWHFWLGDRWTMRIARDWKLQTRYVGTQTNADPKTGILPVKDEFGTYDRLLRVIDATDWPAMVLLEDRHTVRHVANGSVIFDYLTKDRVDPRTGAWADGPHKGEIVVFPRDVEKRTYVMRSNYLEGIPLAFAGTDKIGGLDTYIFAYRGPAEYTAAYKGTADFPGYDIKPGQEIRCADDQFYFRTWVEPITGAMVKVEEGCQSGDYVYDAVTNQRLAAVDRWSGVAAGADLARRVTEVHQLRRSYLFTSRYVPAALAVLSVLLLIAGLRGRRLPTATP